MYVSYTDKAKKWWNAMSFEDKFFCCIKHKIILGNDATRQPETLTEDEIVKVYKRHYKID